jgi:RNA polymerase sigma-70 factor (ECF subfamily)
MSEVRREAVVQAPDAGIWLEQHGDYLFKYASFRLRDAAAAEDVVQETFLAALKAYGKFEGRGSERTWLVGILKHKITDHFRRVTREAPIGEEEDEASEHPEFFRATGEWTGHWDLNHAPSEWHTSPDKLVEQHDFWKVFSDCLAPLPARAASAFTLREVDGLSSEEICELLGIKVNNLWVMLHRARLHLRNCLELNWFKRAPDQGAAVGSQGLDRRYC